MKSVKCAGAILISAALALVSGCVRVHESVPNSVVFHSNVSYYVLDPETGCQYLIWSGNLVLRYKKYSDGTVAPYCETVK
jgi:hypothetical protein